MVFSIPEIMKTESFWAPIIGAIALFLMVALILLDRYRRPEIYSKKTTKNKEAKITERNIPDQAI